MSSNYESAVEGSVDGVLSLPGCPTTTPEESGLAQGSLSPAQDTAARNHVNTASKIAVDTPVKDSSAENRVDENQQDPVDTGEPKIPPAFADFLKNLDKKRPRSTPKSLPVRRQYVFDRHKNVSDPIENALPSYSLRSFERNDASHHTRGGGFQ